MTSTSDTLQRFRELVRDRTGLWHAEDRLPELDRLLAQRQRSTGARSVEDYLRRLEARDPAEREWGALLERLTVQESYFYRNQPQLDAFRAAVETMQPADGCLRMLSAGCSRGEEPYTLAMILDAAGRRATIYGVDIVAEAIAHARRSEYGAWALRQTPPELVERYFEERAPGTFVLAARIRDAVSFEQASLVEGGTGAWDAMTYDVVFCRNVLMYFSLDTAREVLCRLTRALTPGGYLFLGHADNMRSELCHQFTLCQSHGAFFYRKDPESLPWAAAPFTVSWPSPPEDGGRPKRVRGGVTPTPTRASTTTSRRGVRVRTALGCTPGPGLPARILEPAFEAYRREEYAEVERLLNEMSEVAQVDSCARLVLAAVSLQRGDLDRARSLGRAVAGEEPDEPAAHYVLAMCDEQSNEASRAAAGYAKAAELDTCFALAHLGLGRLARRRGDRVQARQQFELARDLFACEQSHRLMLFGGGMGRSGLISVCAAELRGLERSE
jgi:chemotaxis protein methyltransferase CheR